MRRIAIAIAAALTLAAGAARADAERWASTCSVDAMTDEKSCGAQLYLRLATQYGTELVSLSANRLANGRVVIILIAGERICTRHEPMLRVDRNDAVTMEILERTGILTGREAGEVLAQFITGTRLRIRTYWGARCKQKDLEATLMGFTAAWRKVEAGESWEPGAAPAPRKAPATEASPAPAVEVKPRAEVEVEPLPGSDPESESFLEEVERLLREDANN